MNRSPLVLATAIGAVAQLAMIAVGHFVPIVREHGFAIGGMLISLGAGALYARLARGGWPPGLSGGALAGGVCALIGIAPSVALGDTPASILVLGTLASTLAGVAGGALGRLLAGRASPAP
jgi:hypothetical protein